MNIHGLTEGMTGEPPAAYALSAITRNDKSDNPTTDTTTAQQSGDVQYSEAYQNRSDSITLSLPDAIRNDSKNSHVASCYCGHCSACDMHAAAKSAGQDEEPKAELESPQEKAAPIDEREKGPHELTEAEKQQVEELQRRDQEVRAHEQAHAAAGATNVRYEYQVGPDGRPYAVGGSADMQTMAMGSDYDSRIAQARQMRAAALAPGDPSPQDMAVAAKAMRLEAEAIAEKAEAEREELAQEADDPSTDHPFDTQAVNAPNEPFNAWA